MFSIQHSVNLAPLTTLELGGPAEAYGVIRQEEDFLRALDWAGRETKPWALIGGGSNIVVGDDGFDGLLLHGKTRGRRVERRGSGIEITASAGEPWDEFVAWTVENNWAGLECLSGIPGTVGASPIQNVGAYGQEVAQTVQRIRVLDCPSRTMKSLEAHECDFAYRQSIFKETPGRYIVVEVTFSLKPQGKVGELYRELKTLFPEDNPSLADLRGTILGIRREKSMVLDPQDSNRRSVGSFFVNPTVSREKVIELRERALVQGWIEKGEGIPQWPVESGLKLSAAWLVEHSGFSKGHRCGQIGLSTAHALAVIHHGGGTTKDLLGFAAAIRDSVRERWELSLRPEPTFLSPGGFTSVPLDE